MPIVIVAYSGGYFPASFICTVGGVSDRLHGMVLMDALYSEHEKFAAWISHRKNGFFFSAYGPSTKDSNIAMQTILTQQGVRFGNAVPPRFDNGTVSFVSAGEEVEHNDS